MVFKKSMKLNVGCGKDIRKEYVNLDNKKFSGVDVVHDLNKFPYPLKNDSFEEIVANHIIEHLDNPENFCEELWRISKKDGRIIIRTPHFSCGSLAWGDLTHKRSFSSLSFHNYNFKNTPEKIKSLSDSRTMKFKVKTVILFGTFHRLVGLQFLFNRFQGFYESFLYGLFPAREIIFDLRVIK